MLASLLIFQTEIYSLDTKKKWSVVHGMVTAQIDLRILQSRSKTQEHKGKLLIFSDSKSEKSAENNRKIIKISGCGHIHPQALEVHLLFSWANRFWVVTVVSRNESWLPDIVGHPLIRSFNTAIQIAEDLRMDPRMGGFDEMMIQSNICPTN